MALSAEVEVLIPALAPMPMAAAVTDSRGVICWANAAFSSLTGYADDELAGQNMAAFRSDASHVLERLGKGESHKANAAIVPAGNAGAVDVFSHDPTDLIIDINGFYIAGSGSGSGGLTGVTDGGGLVVSGGSTVGLTTGCGISRRSPGPARSGPAQMFCLA